MAGEIGFDEGGVLQALATPVIDHTETTSKTLKNGKVVTKTTRFQITGAQIIALLLGAKLLELFARLEPGALGDWKPGDNISKVSGWFEDWKPGQTIEWIGEQL